MSNEIKKLYNISLIGEKDLQRKMEAVNRSFDTAKQNFLDLKATLAKGGLSTDEMKNLKTAVEAARLETIKLNQERIRLTNDGVALNNSLKQERLNRIENNQTLGKSTDAYKQASKDLNEMRANVKAIGVEFGITSPQFLEGAKKLQVFDKELKAIDAAVGQFQRNVGNYPKEIKIGSLSKETIQSLKNAGLGDALSGQINRVKRDADQLDQEFIQIRSDIQKLRTSGVESFEALEKQMIENRIEAGKLRTEIKDSTLNLNGFGDVGNGVMGKFNSSLTQVALGYVGVQAAASAIRELVGDTKELSDQTTNLEIELGKTVGGADKLVDSLSKLDTRTKLTVLEDIANTATKAGTAEENLLGVTEAIDKTKVAFGKDFGDIEQGTETFAKLINIFYEDREITGDRILKIGNSVRTLANETVASVPYINDFSGRMAGLRQLFENFKLSESIGLGAGFEEFKQSAEVASTALVKILPKLASDTAKFAKILGIPQEEFRKLINDNPVEALIQVSEKLVKTKGGVEGIANAFADAELGAGRITTILGTLGGKADVFRDRIKRAGETIEETTAIEQAFLAKNENLAGTLDKVSKKFSDSANSKGFVTFIKSASEVLLGLISIITAIPFGVIVTGVTLVAAAWLYYKGASISAGLAQQWNNEQMLLGQLRLIAQRIGLIANTEATIAQAEATRLAKIEQTGLNVAMGASPLGIIFALLALVIPLMSAFASETDHAAVATLRFNDSEKIKKQVLDKSNKTTSETITKIDLLVGSLKDAKVSVDTKKEAMSQLIKIDKEFDGVMEGNIVNLDKLKAAYDKVTESIKLKATAEATATLLAEREKEAAEVALLKKKLEIAASETRQRSKDAGATVSLSGLSDNEQKILGIDEKNLQFAQNQYERYIKKVLDAETKAAELYRKYAQINADAQKALGLNTQPGEDSPSTIPGPADPSKASKLSGEQKDYLRDINALREAELSELKKAKLEGSIEEEKFLKQSLEVNIKYNNQILDHFKGTDAITRKLRADTAADSIDKQIETNEKLFKIQEDAIKQEYENAKAAAQSKYDNVTSDPNAKQLDRVAAENVFYQEVLEAQVNFNTQMDALEKDLNLKSKKNAQDRKNILLKEENDLNRSKIQLSKAQFDSLIQGTEDFAEYRQNQIAIEASIKRVNIERDKSLSIKEKDREIDKINTAEDLANINAELGKVNAQIKFYEDRREQQRLTNEELAKYNELLKQKQLLEEGKAFGETEIKIKGIVELQLPSASSMQNAIQSLFTDANGKFIIGTDKNGNDVDGGALLGQAIAESFDLATQAMNAYFEGERQNVEQSKKLAYERIDLEREQKLNTAQSAAERETIEKEARQKKDKADKEASEKYKKIKRSEATVAYFTELAYIAVAAAQNPLNGITLGAAGIAMYALLAGLATARYGLNVAAINKQQFGRGGSIPKRGGVFSGPSHDDGGIPVGDKEFEGDEVAIINKNSAKSNRVYSVTGTPKQIASAINEVGGGVSFASGAIFKKYASGDYFGNSVQPPIFRSYYQNTSSIDNSGNDIQSERLDRIERNLERTAETLTREVHRKTYVSSKEITRNQNDDSNQSDIGTL